MQLVKIATAIVAVAFTASEAAEVVASNSLAASIRGAHSTAGLEDPVMFARKRCPEAFDKCLEDRACFGEIRGVLIGGLNPISPAAQDLQKCVSSALFSLSSFSPAGLEDPVKCNQRYTEPALQVFINNRCPKAFAKCLWDGACSQEIRGVLIGGLWPISPAAQELQQCVANALFNSP
jgi:hypothetical protein